jgi:DNA-binding PadR family transcriptional regulator
LHRTNRGGKRPELGSGGLTSPHGGPRGLLLYYIIHRIASKPSHGYEILQDIESKTEGAWRPGAGSIYPILKNLVSKGLIKAESAEEGDTRRVYRITAKGLERLQDGKKMFLSFSQRWSSLRGLIIDLIDPEYIESFFLDGSKKQFQFAQQMLKSKMGNLTTTQIEYLLREYALNLERQLDWTNQTLKESKSRPVVARAR